MPPASEPARPASAPPAPTALLDGLAHGVVIHRQFQILYANPAMARRAGCASVAAFMADPSLLRFVPEQDRAEALARHQETLAGGPVWRGQVLRHLTEDGGYFWAQIDETVIDWEGAPALLVTAIDVTKEVEARAKERILSEAIDQLTDSFILYGPDDRVLLTNRRFHEVFDYMPPQAAMAGRAMRDLVSLSVAVGAVIDPGLGEDAAAWIDRFIARRREPQPIVREDTLPNGRWDLVKEQRLPSGAFVSVRTDITERKRAELALKDHEARLESALAERTAQLEAILANIAQGVAVTDPEARVVLTNRGFYDLYNFPQALRQPEVTIADFARHRLSQGRYLEWEDPEAGIETLVRRVIERHGRMTREVYQETLADGRMIEVRRQRLPNDYVVSTYTDVTDRVTAQQELQRQREALYQSEKLSALGLLLAGVAHELNNPLSVVIGQATMLEGFAEDARDRERAGKIRTAAERCARIVKVFLSMARGQPASRAPVPINELLERALELAAEQLRSSRIDVQRDFAPALPPVHGDADQLTQMLVNLLINARQAMAPRPAPRRLLIATRSEPAGQAEGGAVVIEVSDSGPGVPVEIRRRVFDPFFTTKPQGSGTGIGLAVCHAMASAHGGSIAIDDGPLGGARVTIRLPCGEAARQPPPAAPAAEPAGRLARVLVVDDEPEIRQFLADLLQSEGYEVDLAASGEEGLARLAGQAYGAIICDLRMPRMDGPDFFAAVRASRPELCGRFIFITGDVLGEHSSAFLAGIEQPCLEKPFMPDQVRRLVTQTVARSLG